MAWNEKTSPTFEDFLIDANWQDNGPGLEAIAKFNSNFDSDTKTDPSVFHAPPPSPSSMFGPVFNDNEMMDPATSVEAHELSDASASFFNVDTPLQGPFDEFDMPLASSFLFAGREEDGHRRSISEPPETFASFHHPQNNARVHRMPYTQVLQSVQPTFVRRSNSNEHKNLDARPVKAVPKSKIIRSRPYPPAAKDQFTRNRAHPMSHFGQSRQPPTSAPSQILRSQPLSAQAPANYASSRVCTPERDASPGLNDKLDPRLRGQTTNSSQSNGDQGIVALSKDELRVLIVDAVDKVLKELPCPVRVVEGRQGPAMAGIVESVEKEHQSESVEKQ